MPSFSEFLTGNPTATATKKKSSSFSDFLQQTAVAEKPKPNQLPPSKSPFNPNTPGNAEFNKQLDQKIPKPGILNNLSLGDFGKGAKETSKLVTDLPVNLVVGTYNALVKPSDGAKQVEQAGEVEKLPPVAKQIAQGLIRIFIPGVETFSKQVGTAIGTKGKELPSSLDAFMAAADTSLTFGSVGALGLVKDILGSGGDVLVNKNTTLKITPEELRIKLANGEIKTPQGQQLAKELIKNGQSIEATGTEPRGGMAQKVGEKIGGKVKPANPKITVSQTGQPIAGELSGANLTVIPQEPQIIGTVENGRVVPTAPIGKYPTIHLDGKIKMVEGEPVKIVDGVETFLHKGDGGWIVSEASTGRFLSQSVTKNGAIAKAKFKIDNVGKDKFLKLLEENKITSPVVAQEAPKTAIITPVVETPTPVLELSKTQPSAQIASQIETLQKQKTDLLATQDNTGTEQAMQANKKIYSQVDNFNKQIKDLTAQKQAADLTEKLQVTEAAAREKTAVLEKEKIIAQQNLTAELSKPKPESPAIIAAKKKMIKLLQGKNPAEVQKLFKTIPGLQKMFPDGELKLTPPVKVKTVIKPDWVKSDDLTPGIIEQLKNSEPGKRMAGAVVNGQGSTVDTIAWHSSFPDWIPEDLRKSSIVKPVAKHLQNGTLPTVKKQVDLYNHIGEMIDAENLAKQEAQTEIDKQAYTNGVLDPEKVNTLINQTQAEINALGKDFNDQGSIQKTGQTSGKEKTTGSTPSKIAKSIEAKAIEQKLTQGFEGVAGYDKITIKDQAQKATDLINSDIEKARAIIRGEQPLPDGLKGTALITVAEEYIKNTGDAQMAFELANSPLVSETSAAAQELRLAAERTPDSATAKLQEIKKAREAKAEAQKSKEVRKVVKTAKVETEKLNLTKEEVSWDKFLAEITC